MRARSGQLNSYVIVPTLDIDSEGDASWESRFSITKQDAVFILEHGWQAWVQSTPMCVVSYRTALLHAFDYAQRPEAIDGVGGLADDDLQARLRTATRHQPTSELVQLANDLASDNPFVFSESNIVEWMVEDPDFRFHEGGVSACDHCRNKPVWPVGLPTNHWKMVVDSRGLPSVEVPFVPPTNPAPELQGIAEARLNLYLLQTRNLSPFLPFHNWKATGPLGTYVFTPEGKMERAWGNLAGEAPVSDSSS